MVAQFEGINIPSGMPKLPSQEAGYNGRLATDAGGYGVQVAEMKPLERVTDTSQGQGL